MLVYLILLFTIVPVVELAILLKVGGQIGLFYTLSIVIITGVSGAYLAKWQGLTVLNKMQSEINQGRLPADKIFDGIIILCCGLLLLTPGFITDILGFLGLIPLTRNILKNYLRLKAQSMVDQGKVITITSYKST